MKKWIVSYGTVCGLDGTMMEYEIEVEDDVYDILARMLLEKEISEEEKKKVNEIMDPLYQDCYDEELENYRWCSYEEDEDSLVKEFNSIFNFDYLCEENYDNLDEKYDEEIE